MRAHVEHYRRVGYTQPIDVFSRAESVTLRRRFFEAVGQTEEQTRHIAGDLPNWHTRHQWCAEMMRNPRLVDLVQDLLDAPDIMIWSMLFWYKQAGDVTYVPWHQDGAYWPMKPVKTITAWVALGDVDRDNGALHFLPGRRTDLRSHVTLDDPRSEFTTEFPDAITGTEEVAVDMTAGQVCLFDAYTVHRTGPNRTSRARIGCGIRYTTPDVAFDPAMWRRYQPEIVMLQGQDSYGLNPAFMRTGPDNALSMS
ncbi:MAG: phytanoyl-CoA dioxygenase family protein [Azospirillaceae bacterium]|nr:phytanoyl-CoA dioxygenase family protein [Azospirillaceae bacterium]